MGRSVCRPEPEVHGVNMKIRALFWTRASTYHLLNGSFHQGQFLHADVRMLSLTAALES